MKLTITDKTLYGLILLGIMLTGCLNNVTDGWTRAGREGEYINRIKTDQQRIYAATRTDLYRKSLQGNGDWESMGLQQYIEGREVRDFIVFSEKEILAGVGSYPEFEEGTIPLWKTTTGGENWKPYQNGFGKEGNYNSFTGIDATATKDTLYSTAIGAIARSVDQGKSWHLVRNNWSTYSLSLFIHVDKQTPRNIWAGGSGFIPVPKLSKSSDYGESWENLEPIKYVETNVHDIVIHPTNSDNVMVGMSAALKPAKIIRRSVDGGQTWETVFEGVGVRALAQSPRDGRRVYASGLNATGTLSFAKTDDFGDTWELVEHEDGPAGIWVNDLAAVEHRGREVLYFGTTKGVYSCTFAN